MGEIVEKLGIALNLSHNTMATGAVYYHRFYMFHSFQEFLKQVGVSFFHVKFTLCTYSMQVGLNQSIMQGLHIMPRKNEYTIDRAYDKSKDYL